ncbi:MAG: hypothetical protein WAT93_07840 [Pontixanthobacter sp.]
MVEIFVPFLLILMSWNDADPAGTLDVTAQVYLDQQACIVAGAEAMAAFSAQQSELLENRRGEAMQPRRAEFRCVEAPRDITRTGNEEGVQ